VPTFRKNLTFASKNKWKIFAKFELRKTDIVIFAHAAGSIGPGNLKDLLALPTPFWRHIPGLGAAATLATIVSLPLTHELSH
jgi:hypothetical protein